MDTSYEAFLLALTLWREARGEGPEGMLAVGNVIRNRGNNIVDIIIQKNQFSSMTVVGDAQTVSWPKKDDKIFLAAISLAVNLLTSTVADNTFGATFYFNPATAKSRWFTENIVESGNYEVSAQIGNHTFFRKCPSKL